MDMQGANGPDFGARGSRRYIRTAVEASLRRLGTDWIDLYQTAPAGPGDADRGDPVGAGRSRPRGQGPLPRALQLRRLAARRRRLDRHHRRVHAVRLRAERVLAAARGTSSGSCCRPRGRTASGCCPYFPLYNGLLTGKYTRDHAPGGARLTEREAAPAGVRAVGRARRAAGPRRRTRHHHAATGVRLAARAAAGVVGDRRAPPASPRSRRTRRPPTPGRRPPTIWPRWTRC